MLAPVDVATGIRPRIEVRELDMSYGDRVIQRNLSFTVDPGDIFVIMGPSGSGKSTLLRHMIGLLPPARGDVYTTRRASGRRTRAAGSGFCAASVSSTRTARSGAR